MLSYLPPLPFILSFVLHTYIMNHAFAGQLNCFAQLAALLHALHDRGNVVPK
jgi:hypothetical protein